jgi:Fe-S oxidoreductase
MSEPADRFPRLRAFEKALYHCATCNYCAAAVWQERGIDGLCATLQAHSPAASYSGKGYLAAARALLEGEPLDLTTVAERAFACTTCGNCEAVCPIGMPPATAVKALRAELVDQDQAPAGALTVCDAVLTEQNPWGAAAMQGADWQFGLVPHPQPDLWLLPGCAAAHRQPGEARAAAQLLTVIGHDVAWPQHTVCCGAPLAALGFEQAETQQAQVFADTLPAKVPLAVLGGDCLAQLSGGDAAPHSVLQLLHAALHDGRLAVAPRSDSPPPQVVAVQDSCHLSKPHHGLGQLDAPRLLREVLAVLGCEVVHNSAAPRHAVCCGAAGGMAQLHQDAARRMAAACLAGAERHGAEALITASPLCGGHLALTAAGQLPVYGICEFIAVHYAVAGPEE